VKTAAPKHFMKAGKVVFGSELRLGTPMENLYCVYILRSRETPHHYYTGFTENMADRLAHPNSGGDPHSAKYRPWDMKTCVAFTNRQQVLDF
jgi:predicted GIY-YIG superfamily endonuclease